MSAKSTSIGDLPNVNSNDKDGDQETMMVNSILKEIENDDDIDNSESAINYTIDTSQIPPKINEQIPTREMIEETTREIFQQPMPEPMKVEPRVNISNNLMEAENHMEDIDKNGLSNFLTDEPKAKNMESITDKIISKTKHSGIILILFIILTLPQLNKIILKFLPKMAIEGPQMSILGNILKGVLLALIYMGVSFLL
tara:strand:- start:10569 stop:11162 length:594 start_codon:yes stop_codon:yes gene_type:complete